MTTFDLEIALHRYLMCLAPGYCKEAAMMKRSQVNNSLWKMTDVFYTYI